MTTYTLTVHTHEPDHGQQPPTQRLLDTVTTDSVPDIIDATLHALHTYAPAGRVHAHLDVHDQPTWTIVIDLTGHDSTQISEAIADEGRDLSAHLYWNIHHAQRWEPRYHATATPGPDEEAAAGMVTTGTCRPD